MNLPLAWDAFGPHPSPVRAHAVLDMLLTIRTMQRTRIFSLHPRWFTGPETMKKTELKKDRREID